MPRIPPSPDRYQDPRPSNRSGVLRIIPPHMQWHLPRQPPSKRQAKAQRRAHNHTGNTATPRPPAHPYREDTDHVPPPLPTPGMPRPHPPSRPQVLPNPQPRARTATRLLNRARV
nr:MAG TPA: hypothetical protein [Caudoviricetes sp.]DAV32317.1 MAG TPA: hypothetical protein [Caudoviricetes sp.]